MSEPRSLPPRPDLRHLRAEAKRRRKAGEFPSLALAQLSLAREYGFRSWPRLKFHVEAATLSRAERAGALVASATSTDLRRARALLEADGSCSPPAPPSRRASAKTDLAARRSSPSSASSFPPDRGRREPPGSGAAARAGSV